MENVWHESKFLIGKGHLGKALSLLLDEVAEDLKNEVILYQFRLNDLKREERIFQKNTLEEKIQLNSTVLEFISTNELKKPQASRLSPVLHRIERLRQKIIDIYELLAEWEEKESLAENPSEKKRSAIEIRRLKNIIKEHSGELENLKRTS